MNLFYVLITGLFISSVCSSIVFGQQIELFNGQDLDKWHGDRQYWRAENGMIVGEFDELPHNQFLWHEQTVKDFRLTLQVRVVTGQGNSGVQFRSEALPGGHVRGPQADIGTGFWGKLYEEHGRAWLWDDDQCEQYVNPHDWNEYEILAIDSRILTALNGQRCVDLDDPYITRSGIIALQLHSGWAPAEIQFKNIFVEMNPDLRLKTID